jgi:hypothetical protein
MQEAVRHPREFQLNDSTVYYFGAINHTSLPSYLPTDQDILLARVKPGVIMETTFKVAELTLFDVSAQRRSGVIVSRMLRRLCSQLA